MDEADGGGEHPPAGGGRWVRFGIALLLVGAVAAFIALGGSELLSFATLSAHREELLAWRDRHGVLAVAAFLAVYAVTVALSLPGALWLTIAGGFLFGAWRATAYVVIAATLGACAIFLITRYIAGDWLTRRAGPAIRRMEAGFRTSAFSYLLVLRLLPVFPFWLVNVVPALLNVPFRTYALATLIGIVPGTLVYALVGDGLGAVMDADAEPDLGIILEPRVLAPLIGLALLALAPVVYRDYVQRRARRRSER